jgi:hypothetical protein
MPQTKNSLTGLSAMDEQFLLVGNLEILVLETTMKVTFYGFFLKGKWHKIVQR